MILAAIFAAASLLSGLPDAPWFDNHFGLALIEALVTVLLLTFAVHQTRIAASAAEAAKNQADAAKTEADLAVRTARERGEPMIVAIAGRFLRDPDRFELELINVGEVAALWISGSVSYVSRADFSEGVELKALRAGDSRTLDVAWPSAVPIPGPFDPAEVMVEGNCWSPRRTLYSWPPEAL